MWTYLDTRFLRRGSNPADGPTITGPIMAQYLMAMLGQRDPSHEMFGRGLGDLADGRMGDYVFNQEGNFYLVCHDHLIFDPTIQPWIISSPN
jgi:hypothetical protein